MTYTRQTNRYVNIMVSLTRSPKTTRELANDLGMKWYQSLSDTLQQMRKLHIVRVQKWVDTGNVCKMKAAVWTATPGVDADPPLTANGHEASNLNRRQVKASSNLLAFAHVWEAMDGGKRSTQELADLSGFSIGTVQDLIRRLHEARLVYVARYERQPSGGEPIRFYSLGRRDDVERPEPESKSVCNEKRRIRARMRNIQTTTLTMQ